MSDTLIDGLAGAITSAAQTFEAGREWPAALLWPDPDRQWFPAFAELRRRLAQRKIALYAHGDYTPDDGVGPAIWLRCLIEAPHSPGLIGAPVDGALTAVLLPGISWRNLREPLTLPRGLQMLVEMQYRGDVFRQRRQARDWTVATFLRDPDQGLGLDVATDARTDEAARRALSGLLDFAIDGWRGRRLAADDFDGLLVDDKERDLLRWIADPDAARLGKSASAWDAFRDQIKREYGVDVDEKGALQTAVERLIRRTGAWSRAWSRLSDAPGQFRPVCERIREATIKKQGDFLEGLNEGDPVRNPHDNAWAEKMLAQDFGALPTLSPREAAAKVFALEERHRARRDTLWARLGEAPLAIALEPLARLAKASETTLTGDDLAGLASSYADEGWRIDAALIEAVAAGEAREDLVGRAAGTLYRPWVDALARRFRVAYEAAGEPARPRALAIDPGTVVLFVDGLRMDVGRAVAERLSEAGVQASLSWRLAPVPTVTATAKALVTPVADSVAGRGKVEAFLPLETSTGKPATTDVLRKAMLARGVQVLDRDRIVPPEKSTTIGYAECGNLDSDGHALGLRLAGQVDTEVRRIVECVLALKASGWARIRVVTDHGWLLMPGGFDVVRLPASATETAWSRAAILGEGAAPELVSVPWHWDNTIRIAMPLGAEAFRAGEVYSHGGLSPQECVVPDITVGDAEVGTIKAVRIDTIAWRRLRLTVELTGDLTDVTVEVRRKERDSASRVDVVSILEGARARLTVSDEIEEGDPVLVVVIDRHGSVLDVRATRVGDRA